MGGLGYPQQQNPGPEGGQLLVCRACGHERVVTSAWIGQLRDRAPVADCDDCELLARFLPLFTCSRCRARNVELVPEAQKEPEPRLADPGGLSPLCVQCGEAIPVKRLRAVPGTPFCVRCQEEFEQGQPEDDTVNCKRCGAKMVWRVRQSVLPTKYFLGCSNYPRCNFAIAGSW